MRTVQFVKINYRKIVVMDVNVAHMHQDLFVDIMLTFLAKLITILMCLDVLFVEKIFSNLQNERKKQEKRKKKNNQNL